MEQIATMPIAEPPVEFLSDAQTTSLPRFLYFCHLFNQNDSSRMSGNPSEGLSAFIKINFSSQRILSYVQYYCYTVNVYNKAIHSSTILL